MSKRRDLPRAVLTLSRLKLPVTLVLATVAAHGTTALSRYAFRDDYPLLQEAREEPGKIARVCATQGRILYGLVLEAAMRWAGDVDALAWVRFGAALGLGLVAALMARTLTRAGWGPAAAWALSAFLVSLPSAQVLSSWATCSPQVLSVLLSLAAFVVLDEAASPLRRAWGRVAASNGMVAAAALIYQSNALFFLVPLVATVLTSRAKSTERVLSAVGVLGAGLALAYGVMRASFALGLYVASSRLRFETDLVGKLLWAARNVGPDALAQSLHRGTPGFHVALTTVASLIALGGLSAWRREGLGALGRWAVAVLLLTPGTYAISLVASERWPSYRSLFPLSAAVSVLLFASLRQLGAHLPTGAQRAARALLVGLAIAAGLWARHQTLELIAEPQALELAVLERGAERAARLDVARVYAITAIQSESPAPRRSRDEFGSVTNDAAWVTQSAFAVVMRERAARVGRSLFYTFTAGRQTPRRERFDVVIDFSSLSMSRVVKAATWRMSRAYPRRR